MRWTVTLRATAEKDLASIRKWYERQRPGLGEDFLHSAAEKLSQLETSAGSIGVYYKSFRQVLTKRFPYKIFFKVRGDAAIVFRVLHSAQDHTKRLR